MKVLVVDDDGTVHQATPGMECPLCLAVGLPPADRTVQATQGQPLARLASGIPAARLAALVGAPLPPRGPPSYT